MDSLKPKKIVTKHSRKLHVNKFKHIPKELLTEILFRVASSSFTDFCNAKASCEEFLQVAIEDYFFEHVSLNPIPIISWKINHAVSSFLFECKRSGNPEALFRRGMVDYFSKFKKQESELDFLKKASGLELLKEAAKKEHMEANYVCGIVLVCNGGESRKEGLKLLSKFERSNLSLVITDCRKKVRDLVKNIWVDDNIVGFGSEEEEECSIKSCTCNSKKKAVCSCTGARSRWTMDSDYFEEDSSFCDSCLWRREATRFLNMLRTGRYAL